MKNVPDKLLVFAIFTLFLILAAARVYAGQYVFKGVYPVETIFINLCENCFLSLPPEYLQSNITLSVNTDKVNELERSIIKASAAVGWQVRKVGGGWSAEPIQNDGNLVYISCMTSEPVNVPKYLYSYAVKSDSIKCAQRDSMRIYGDSIATAERRRLDSLAALPPLDYRHYELRYYAFSKSFTDKIGVEWPTIWASGNLRGRLRMYDDWSLIATALNDTTFTVRRLLFSVDSSLSVDWGSEEQTLKTTFVNDGVTSSDYEWRKYGLIVNVSRDGRRIRMQYIFRDKSGGVSLLQGSAIGDEGDTLRMLGTYTANRNVVQGVPILSSIPILNLIFSTNETSTEQRAFELYLVPVSNDYKRKQFKQDK